MLKKILMLSTLSVLTTACSKNYEVNSCIQKPDSMEIWKVIDNAGDKSLELQNGEGMGQITPLVGSDWIKTDCP